MERYPRLSYRGWQKGVVPYVYTGADGKEHMEIGVGEENRDDYIATIDILDANAKTASLSGYTENRPTGNPLCGSGSRNRGRLYDCGDCRRLF